MFWCGNEASGRSGTAGRAESNDMSASQRREDDTPHDINTLQLKDPRTAILAWDLSMSLDGVLDYLLL